MSTVIVSALSTGHLTLPERFFVTPSDPEARQTVPSLSFLIQYLSPDTSEPTRMVFDLGLRRSTSLYPNELQNHIANRQPMTTNPDIVESLAKGGLTVDDIDYVVFSHVHYDHVGYPKDFTNPKTKFVVGPGAKSLLSGEVTHNVGSHSFFEPDLLPPERTLELPPLPRFQSASSKGEFNSYEHNARSTLWTSLPPFPHVHPLIILPSSPFPPLLIVSAPGHLPGHISLLCLVSLLPPKYVLLAGDSVHDKRLLAGTHRIATWREDDNDNDNDIDDKKKQKQCCIHVDVPAAEETIERLKTVMKHGIRSLNDDPNEVTIASTAEVEIVFAHDWEWEMDAKKRGRFWPGRL